MSFIDIAKDGMMDKRTKAQKKRDAVKHRKEPQTVSQYMRQKKHK